MHASTSTSTSPYPAHSCSPSHRLSSSEQDPFSFSYSSKSPSPSPSSSESTPSLSSHVDPKTNSINKIKRPFDLTPCSNCQRRQAITMAIVNLTHVSPIASVDCLRPNRPRHQQLALPLPTPQQIPGPSSSLHLLSTQDFTYDAQHAAAVGQLLQSCRGLQQIACETDYRLLGPHAVAMAVATESMSLSDKTAIVVGNPIDYPISIYDLAHSRSQLRVDLSLSSTCPASPSLIFPKFTFNDKMIDAYNCCFLDDVRRRTRRCLDDRLWLNPDAPQEGPQLDHPLYYHNSLVWSIGRSEQKNIVEEEEEENCLELVLAEMDMKVEKSLFPRSKPGFNWSTSNCSTSAIETLDRANPIESDPPSLSAHAVAAATAAASGITHDRRTTNATAIARFKHDDINNDDESSVFGLGVPSLSSASVSRHPCYHTCTATPTTTALCSITTTAINPSPSLPLSPLPAMLFLDPPSLSSSVTSSLDANLRSLSPEKPNCSTTIDEAPSSSISFFSSSPFILLPPLTSTFMTSAPFSTSSTITTPKTPTATTTMTMTTGGFNLNHLKSSPEHIDAPASSITTSSIALNSPLPSSSFANSFPAQQLLTSPHPQQQQQQQHQHRSQYHPYVSTSMGHINPANIPGPPSSSTLSSSLASSASMSDLFRNYRCQQDSSSSRITLDPNGDPVGGNASDGNLDLSRVTSSCDHSLDSDSDLGVDMVVVDRDGNPAASNQRHEHPQHRNHDTEQARDDGRGGLTQEEMHLRGEILARISPRATMMSRTPPSLPEVPVWNEPVAHQIRRIQSTHMAELRRQWEDQQRHQQQRGQAQVQQDQYQQEHQRQNSHSPIRRSVSISRYVSVAMERTSVGPQRTISSSNSAESQIQDEAGLHTRALARGSNSLYLNHEGGALRPEERWRRGRDDMVGR